MRATLRSSSPILALAALIAGIGFLALVSTQARTLEDRLREANQARTLEDRLREANGALARVRVSATVVVRSLAATEAIADFGIEKDVELVMVRIVDQLQVELRVETPETIELAEPPRVCLAWYFSAPDDAGLSDRCWGEPDLGGLLAAQLARDEAGHALLPAGRPIVVEAALRRGDVRCDYPPGRWQLEMALEPLVDGAPVGALDLPPVGVEVPATGEGPLPYLRFDTRFCGLASAVYLEQGEPPVALP